MEYFLLDPPSNPLIPSSPNIRSAKPEGIKQVIKKYEKEGVILKYKAVINKELIKDAGSEVRALIEVNITPQK